MVLHGGGSRESGASIARSVGFDAETAGRRLIAVYPDARGGTFHAGHCCGGRPTRGDDVRFVVRLVDRVQRRYPVDARRTFATGFSNDAFLAYRVAASLPVALRRRDGCPGGRRARAGSRSRGSAVMAPTIFGRAARLGSALAPGRSRDIPCAR